MKRINDATETPTSVWVGSDCLPFCIPLGSGEGEIVLPIPFHTNVVR
jgi:hypothetical protein